MNPVQPAAWALSSCSANTCAVSIRIGVVANDVEAGHGDVHQDDVGSELTGGIERFGAGLRLDHAETGVFEEFGVHFAHVSVIVGYQNQRLVAGRAGCGHTTY